MGPRAIKTKEISLGEDFGDVTVKANGVAVDIHADGTIEHYPILKVKRRHRLAIDEGKGRRPAKPDVGDRMLDGTIYAGISPDTNQPMYATPADAAVTVTLNEAFEIAARLDAHGHKDWRVPTKAELGVLFNNRAAIGGFDITGSIPAGWYWSSFTRDPWNAGCQRFTDGAQDDTTKANRSSLRCVR